jgi:NADH-quinone oxidoreductase subunit E
VTYFTAETRARAQQLVALYPRPRSALIPLCHLAQESDGWLHPEAMEEIAELIGITPAEVRGTATFYDMFDLEPSATYRVSVCTNVACLLDGALELLAHAEERLGVSVGGSTRDGTFMLEESECLADCNFAPCVQVNHRFVRARSPEAFDQLVDDLASGRLAGTVPPHGTLQRVARNRGLMVDPEKVAGERAAMGEAQAQRAAAREKSDA